MVLHLYFYFLFINYNQNKLENYNNYINTKYYYTYAEAFMFLNVTSILNSALNNTGLQSSY